MSLLHYYMYSSDKRTDGRNVVIPALIRAGPLNNTVDSVLGHPLHLADAAQIMLLAEHGARYDLTKVDNGRDRQEIVYSTTFTIAYILSRRR